MSEPINHQNPSSNSSPSSPNSCLPPWVVDLPPFLSPSNSSIIDTFNPYPTQEEEPNPDHVIHSLWETQPLPYWYGLGCDEFFTDSSYGENPFNSLNSFEDTSRVIFLPPQQTHNNDQIESLGNNINLSHANRTEDSTDAKKGNSVNCSHSIPVDKVYGNSDANNDSTLNLPNPILSCVDQPCDNYDAKEGNIHNFSNAISNRVYKISDNDDENKHTPQASQSTISLETITASVISSEYSKGPAMAKPNATIVHTLPFPPPTTEPEITMEIVTSIEQKRRKEKRPTNTPYVVFAALPPMQIAQQPYEELKSFHIPLLSEWLNQGLYLHNGIIILMVFMLFALIHFL